MKVSEIFEDEPTNWGLRGDLYLWREMKELLKETEMPDSSELLKVLIETVYETATGHSVSYEKHFIIERFKHGGMSSGGISQEFWVNQGIPLLVMRYVKK